MARKTAPPTASTLTTTPTALPAAGTAWLLSTPVVDAGSTPADLD